MVGGVEDELLLEVEESPGLSVSPHVGLASPAHYWTLSVLLDTALVDTVTLQMRPAKSCPVGGQLDFVQRGVIRYVLTIYLCTQTISLRQLLIQY